MVDGIVGVFGTDTSGVSGSGTSGVEWSEIDTVNIPAFELEVVAPKGLPAIANFA